MIKKLLITTLLLLPLTSFGAISLVATSTGVSGTDNVTTTAVDTTGADLIVISVGYNQGSSFTLSDNKSNTWNALTLKGVTGSVENRLYYATSTGKNGSGHTFTATGSFIYASMNMACFSGAHATAPFDVQNGATTAGAATLATGSVTPSQDNSLIVAGLGFNVSSAGPTINSSFTRSSWVNFGSGNNYGSAEAYLVQTTAGAVNPTWTKGNTEAAAATIAVFKPAAATPSATSSPVFNLNGSFNLNGLINIAN